MDEMVGWYHRLNGHEFDQAPEDGKGQGSLVGCSPWGHKESDTTQQLNDNNHLLLNKEYSKIQALEIPVGPVVRTGCFHCQGLVKELRSYKQHRHS